MQSARNVADMPPNFEHFDILSSGMERDTDSNEPLAAPSPSRSPATTTAATTSIITSPPDPHAHTHALDLRQANDLSALFSLSQSAMDNLSGLLPSNALTLPGEASLSAQLSALSASLTSAAASLAGVPSGLPSGVDASGDSSSSDINSGSSSNTAAIAAGVAVPVGLLLIAGLVGLWILRRRKQKRQRAQQQQQQQGLSMGSHMPHDTDKAVTAAGGAGMQPPPDYKTAMPGGVYAEKQAEQPWPSELPGEGVQGQSTPVELEGSWASDEASKSQQQEQQLSRAELPRAELPGAAAQRSVQQGQYSAYPGHVEQEPRPARAEMEGSVP